MILKCKHSLLSLPGEPAPTTGGALAGCWFTLAALAGDPGERDRVQRQVRQNGGRVFDERRTKLVVGAGALSSAFAICPFGFPSALQTAARRHADFRLGAHADSLGCALCIPGLLSFVLYHLVSCACAMAFSTHMRGCVDKLAPVTMRLLWSFTRPVSSVNVGQCRRRTGARRSGWTCARRPAWCCASCAATRSPAARFPYLCRWPACKACGAGYAFAATPVAAALLHQCGAGCRRSQKALSSAVAQCVCGRHARVSASGMDDAAKATVKEIVKHLGGKYTIHMTRQNTHLVVERAAGQKFFAAPAYAVVPVTPEWLLASADAGTLSSMDCHVTAKDVGGECVSVQPRCAGKLLPEADFYPPPPPLGAGDGITDEGRATASAQSQDLGPAELPPYGRPAWQALQVGTGASGVGSSDPFHDMCLT